MARMKNVTIAIWKKSRTYYPRFSREMELHTLKRKALDAYISYIKNKSSLRGNSNIASVKLIYLKKYDIIYSQLDECWSAKLI